VALVLADRIKETTTTTGTGTITLSGAQTGFESFAAIGDGNTTYYVIQHTSANEFEVGLGTYTASGTTLSRDTIYTSSNSDAAVNFSAGTKIVFVTIPKEASVYEDASGDVLVQGQVTVGGDPTANLEVATKQYVDNLVASALHFHDAVRVEKEGNLNATYDNGTAGVGATLTNAGTQEALVIDGVTLNTSDRVLVYEQTDATQNGIYTVTNTGSPSTNWVLTRATDADSYAPGTNDGLDEGSYFYVQEGTAGAGESYVCNTIGTITFGTTDITFIQFSATPDFTGGTNIDVTGQTISLTGTVDETNGGTGNNTYTTGDTLYSSASNTLAKLSGNTTTTKKYLSQTGTGSASQAPAWDEINLGTDTAGDYIATGAVSGVGLSGSASGEGSTFTVTSNATNANTASTIVARDASGDFSAGTITAALSGNASTATAWATGRSITLSGDVSGTATGVDGTGNVSITTTIGANSVALGTDTTGSYVESLVAGSLIDLQNNSGEGATPTIDVDLNELATSTTNSDGDYFVVVDSADGSQHKLTKGNINISGFNNDSGFTTNVGDITGVTAGTGMSGGGTSGTVTLDNAGVLSVNSVTGAVTASDLLTAIKTVDGSGSGLDADTVDGLQASQFLRSDASDTTTGDILIQKDNAWLAVDSSSSGSNTVEQGAGISVGESGYKGSAALHMTYTGDGYSHIGMGAVDTSTNLPAYRAMRMYYQSSQVYFDNNPSIAGSTNWHSGNDGSGSGLDADTLDGVEGSNYLRSDTSDTFNGILTVNTTADYQIALTSSNSWCGIGFFDGGSVNEYLWYNGTNGTFAIGGGGSNVSGKKLHIDGGTSIGANSDTVSMPTNGLYVEGDIQTPSSISIGSQVILSESTDRADLLEITSQTSSWAGLQIRNSSDEGRWSFMTDGAVAGIYDDQNADWHVYMTENGSVQLYYNGSSKFTTTGTGVSVTGDVVSSSDENLKENIQPIEDALSKVQQINGVSFNWKDSGNSSIGVIAQNVEKIIPEVVTESDEGIKSVAYGNMVGLLIEAIKEQQASIEKLEARVAELEA
jgi:hypothetical protein